MRTPRSAVGVVSLVLAFVAYCGALGLFFNQTPSSVHRSGYHPGFFDKFSSGSGMLAGVITLALLAVAFALLGLYALKSKRSGS
jgi:hypothetical protein